jgi:hypothetical protein
MVPEPALHCTAFLPSANSIEAQVRRKELVPTHGTPIVEPQQRIRSADVVTPARCSSPAHARGGRLNLSLRADPYSPAGSVARRKVKARALRDAPQLVQVA